MKENELNKIFEEFEKRKDKERNTMKISDIKANELKTATKKILDSIVILLFEKTRKQLIERGHKSDIYVRDDSYLYPSATLSFKPKVKNTTNVIQTEGSRLAFDQDITGDIDINMKINGVKRSHINLDTYTTNYSETCKLRDVTEEFVEKKILNFIQLTMDAY